MVTAASNCKRIEKLEDEMKTNTIHVTEMHERTDAIISGQKTVRNLIIAMLGIVLAGASTVTIKSFTNEAAIRDIEGNTSRHTVEGHPGIRRDVAQIQTRVEQNGQAIAELDSSVESLGDTVVEAITMRYPRAGRDLRNSRSASSGR